MKNFALVATGCIALTQLTSTGYAQPPARTANLLKRADNIAAKVSKIRGLPIKRPIKRGLMTKAQIKKRLLKKMAAEYTPKQIASESLGLKRLGLIPRRMRYKDTVVKLFTDNIAGFYDPADRKLYIAGWTTTGLAMQTDAIMAHEIDHALQDQSFGLDKFMKTVKNNSDASVARQALVEGDGMALMIEYAMMGASPWSNPAFVKMIGPQMRKGMKSQLGSMAGAPLVLREGMLFPYMAGLQFIAHFRRHHGWTHIDKIYRKPPLSTEHILHPKKYVAYERPDTIKIRPLPALRGYKKAHESITGELGFSVFLRQHGLPLARAEQAAAGWGGDVTAVYAPAGHKGGVAGTIGIVDTVWDSKAEAIEAMESLTHAIARFSGGKKLASSTSYIHYHRGRESIVARRSGDRVTIVIGASSTRASTLASQVQRYWRVTRR